MNPPAKHRGRSETVAGSVKALAWPPDEGIEKIWSARSREAANNTEPSGHADTVKGEASGLRYEVRGRGPPPVTSRIERSLIRLNRTAAIASSPLETETFR